MNRSRNTLIGVLLFAALSLLQSEVQAVTSDELERIWKNNGSVEGVQDFRFGHVDWLGYSVAVEGKAPVAGSAPSAKLLAQRAAITDARRNLLLLLYEIRYGLPEKLHSIDISGKVVEPFIDFARISGGTYEVGLTLPLDRLLDECVVFGVTVR